MWKQVEKKRCNKWYVYEQVSKVQGQSYDLLTTRSSPLDAAKIESNTRQNMDNNNRARHSVSNCQGHRDKWGQRSTGRSNWQQCHSHPVLNSSSLCLPLVKVNFICDNVVFYFHYCWFSYMQQKEKKARLRSEANRHWQEKM